MSINSELKYLYFLKKSGIDSFLQNTPIYRFNTTSPKKFKESSAKKKLDEIEKKDTKNIKKELKQKGFETKGKTPKRLRDIYLLAQNEFNIKHE